jgi:hypothetical protein
MQQEKLPIIMMSIIEREKGREGAGAGERSQVQKKIVDEALASLVLLPDGGKILYESSQHAAYYPLSLSRGKAAVITAMYCWLQRRYVFFLLYSCPPFLGLGFRHSFAFMICVLRHCNTSSVYLPCVFLFFIFCVSLLP